MTSDLAAALRRVPLFARLPDGDMQTLASQSRVIARQRGARIFEEGSAADGCFVITAGRAKIVLSGHRGTEIILGMIEPPALIGEVALLDASVRSASLVAVENSQFITIPKASFQALRRNQAFEDRLVANVASTLRRATEQLRAIYTYSSTERISWCLARLAAQRGRRSGSAVHISPRPPHHEIADMTGCSRETVTRTLLQLKRTRLVAWDGTKLSLDISLLKRHDVGAETGAGVIDATRVV